MATWWGATRTAPQKVNLTHVKILVQKPVAALSPEGETMLAKAGGIRYDVSPDLTIGELRQRLITHFAISPRKTVTIRWWGTTLEDQFTLKHYHVSEGGALEMVVKARTMTEIDALAKQVPLTRVRIQTLAGRCVTLAATASTTPRELKQALVDEKLIPGLGKANEGKATLHFSAMAPLLAPGVLPPLVDDRPIGARCALAGYCPVATADAWHRARMDT